MAKMERKTFEVKEQSIEGRTVMGIASVFGNVDDGLDRIWKGAFKKTIAENSKRVRHLWQHDYMQPPTAVITDLREVGKKDLPDWIKEKFPEATGGLLVKRDYLPTPRGDEILAGITSGAIAEMSIGYESVKFDFEEVPLEKDVAQQVRNLREIRLFDTSDVNWGMNAATAAAKTKAAVPYRDTGKADEATDWSKPGLGDFTADAWEDLDDGEKRRIAAHFAWAKELPAEAFGDLKLPHHAPSKTDVGPAVWKGVSAAMARLMQSATEVDDVEAVHAHLAKHYEQFGKEPPTLKSVRLAHAVQLDVVELTKGRGHLIVKDVERIAEALASLNRLLTAEPPSKEALTEQLRLEIAVRERMARS